MRSARDRHDEVLFELVRQIVSGQELHGQIEAAVFQLAEVEDIQDMRMLDARGADGLALKTRHQLGFHRVFGPEDLDRDLLLDGLVEGQIDGPHPALPELFEQSVAPRDDLTQELVRVARHGPRLAHGGKPSGP